MKILFLGHDANRAGAQYLLLHLLTDLRQRNVATGLLLLGDGPLRADYARVTTVYDGFAPPQSPTLLRRVQRRLFGTANPLPGATATQLPDDLLTTLAAAGYDLIFSNTIANGGALRALAPLGLPFVCYVHELENSIRIYTRPDDLRYQIDHARLVLCGSAAVQRNLVQHHGLPTERTAVLNSLIRTEPLLGGLASVDRAAVRGRLGIPADAPIIGGCGHAEWRKGVDLFILTAQQVLVNHPNAHFVWVGVPKQGTERFQLSYDLERMGLTERVHLLEPGGNYLDYLALFDLFTLTSREDPYPLVMLEAGLNRTPVLAFAGSGGSADYVGTDTGCLVPYANVVALAAAIDRLLRDVVTRQQLGAVFYERALAHDTDVLVPRLLTFLQTFDNPVTAGHGNR